MAERLKRKIKPLNPCFHLKTFKLEKGRKSIKTVGKIEIDWCKRTVDQGSTEPVSGNTDTSSLDVRPNLAILDHALGAETLPFIIDDGGLSSGVPTIPFMNDSQHADQHNNEYLSGN